VPGTENEIAELDVATAELRNTIESAGHAHPPHAAFT
jgi:hypothetical protein